MIEDCGVETTKKSNYLIILLPYGDFRRPLLGEVLVVKGFGCRGATRCYGDNKGGLWDAQ